MNSYSRFYGRLHPYVARAQPAIEKALQDAATRLGVPTRMGLTVSAPDFSATQGRDINRVRQGIPDLE